MSPTLFYQPEYFMDVQALMRDTSGNERAGMWQLIAVL